MSVVTVTFSRFLKSFLSLQIKLGFFQLAKHSFKLIDGIGCVQYRWLDIDYNKLTIQKII